MKKYVALARVSSREQEREGFSLDVQEEALQRYQCISPQFGAVPALKSSTASTRPSSVAFLCRELCNTG